MTPSPSKIAVPSITIMFGQYDSNSSNDAFGKWDSYLMWKLTQMTVLHSCQLLPVLPQGTRHLRSIYCHPVFYAPVVWKNCRSLGDCVSLHHLLWLEETTSLSVFKFPESMAVGCVHSGHIICRWLQDIHMKHAENVVHNWQSRWMDKFCVPLP